MFRDIHFDRRDVRVKIAAFLRRERHRSFLQAIGARLKGAKEKSVPAFCGGTLTAILLALLPIGNASAQEGAPGYLPPGEQKNIIRQDIPERKSSPSDVAQNSNASQTQGRTQKTQPRDRGKKPFDVAVIIGNKFYQHDGVPDTAYAYDDADAMRQILIEKYGFRPEKIIWLKDTGQAEMRAIFGTENNIRGRIWRTIDPEGSSRLFVYYSGHGTNDIELQKPYILPVDTEPAEVAVTGYPLDLFYSNLSKLPVKHIFVMLEASFSGRSSQSDMLVKNMKPADVSAKIPKRVKPGRLTIMTAADGKQYSNLNRQQRHGIFTSHLLSGLKGGADADKDGLVTVRELHQYVDAGVSSQAKRDLKSEQTPQLFGNADFAIGKYRSRRVKIAAVDEEDQSPGPRSQEAKPAPAKPEKPKTTPAPVSSADPDPDPASAPEPKKKPKVEEPVAALNSPSRQDVEKPEEAQNAPLHPKVEEPEAAQNPSLQPEVERQERAADTEQEELAYWNEVKDSQNVTGLESYLERYPDGKFRGRALRRIKDIEKQYASLREESDVEEKRLEQEKKRALSRNLQKALKNAGCYSGGIDGIWGPKSRAALKKFANRVNETLKTLEPTNANLKITTRKTKGRVCPAKRPRKKPEPRYVEDDDDDDDDRYDDIDREERYVENDDDEPPVWREPPDDRYDDEGDDEVGLCWSHRNRLVSCDDAEATLR